MTTPTTMRMRTGAEAVRPRRCRRSYVDRGISSGMKAAIDVARACEKVVEYRKIPGIANTIFANRPTGDPT